MKNNKGNAMLLVVIAIVVIVIIAIVVMMGNKNKPENVAGNNDTTIIGDEMQKEIKEVKKFKGLEISNIKIIKQTKNPLLILKNFMSSLKK